MNDKPAEETTESPLSESPVVSTAGVDVTASTEAEANAVAPSAQDEIHRLLRNGLAILGKIEYFTEEEMETFTHWFSARSPKI